MMSELDKNKPSDPPDPFEQEKLYRGLERELKIARLPAFIKRFGLIFLGVTVLLGGGIGIPIYLLVVKQEKISTLKEAKETAEDRYTETVEDQRETIERFKTLYEEGILELEEKIERIESNAPHLLTDTRKILKKFRNAAGSTATGETNISELLYLVSNHPETVHETIYRQLIDEFGIDNYRPKYIFFQHPLARNGRTIVTSEFGRRILVKEFRGERTSRKVSNGSYFIEGYGAGWYRKKIDGKNFLTKSMYHSAYDLISDTDTTVYARHDGRIIADFESYRTYGRTIFYEYRQGGEVYREQLSHLEHGPRTFYKNQKVESGDVLGYIGNTGNTTGPHLHWAVWKQNSEKPGTWTAVDVYSNKLIKSRNIVYLDNMR
jgi:murein DD-endopeptidase MepM/ murein hydrolase activator NlpD